MNNYIQKTKDFITTHYIISAVIAIAVVFIGYKIFAGGSAVNASYTVVQGSVVQKVIVTGKTKAVNSVDLGFEKNGKVSQSFVDVGSRVVVGQPLVSLDTSETYADLLKAQANVASEEARLAELQKGTRPEEITIAETGVTNAKVALSDALNNLNSKINDAYTKSDDAIHNNIDQLFSNGRSNNPSFNLNTTDIQTKNDINSSRFQIEAILAEWKASFDTPTTKVLKTYGQNLDSVKVLLDKVASAVNTQTAIAGLSQTTVDAYKTSISTARTNINTAITNLATAEEKVNTAQSTLTLAQQNLELKKQGNTDEVISAQTAKVMQNKASLQSVEAQLSKMTLRSPLNGIVTKQDAKVGEIVTPGKNVVSIISDSNLEIESNVSEISIGKVMIGNKVNITLDAFPGETFYGTVSYIEPAETIVDGVVNYKVRIAFSEKYPQMKSGLTTNLDIITASKDAVLRIPQYSLIKKDAGYFVSKIGSNKQKTEVPVTVGLVGQDGFVEVISGLAVGDTVAIASTTQ